LDAVLIGVNGQGHDVVVASLNAVVDAIAIGIAIVFVGLSIAIGIVVTVVPVDDAVSVLIVVFVNRFTGVGTADHIFFDAASKR
jgi:hypothetical protein